MSQDTNDDFAVGIAASKNEELSHPAFSLLHRVPKQVANTSWQMHQGTKLVNRKGYGTASPGQIANDRWLSLYDALVDALFIVITSVVIGMYGFNWFTISMLFAMSLYWIFHISWWEHATKWEGVMVVDEYLGQTKKWYTAMFLICLVTFTYLANMQIKEERIIEYPIHERIIDSNEWVGFFIEQAGSYYNEFFGGSEIIESSSSSNHMSELRRKRDMQRYGQSDEVATQSGDKQNFKTRSTQSYNEYLGIAIKFFIYFIAITAISWKFFNNKYSKINVELDEEINKELNNDVKNKQDNLRKYLD